MQKVEQEGVKSRCSGRIGCLVGLTVPVVLVICLSIYFTYKLQQRSLPNGYEVIYVYGTTATIKSSTGRGVVPLGILDWKVAGTVVYGRLEGGRWYVLETTTGECDYFQDWKTVEARLQKR